MGRARPLHSTLNPAGTARADSWYHGPGGPMALHTYPITIEREGKQYYAYSDDFPGVYGLGSSVEAAKKSILRSLQLYIEHCRRTWFEGSVPIPVEK
jgi:predicted RNase H-like HicB family nuclease